MNPLYKCAVCCVLSIVALPVNVKAQSTIPLHWSTGDGNQYLELTGTELHLKPRTDGNGPHSVTATTQLHLPSTKNWQVSFDIRFGELEGQGSSFHLMNSKQDVGWVGADGFYKGMGVFVGKDNEVVVPPADMQWHHISYISNGSTLTAWLDDKQVGSRPACSPPDSLFLTNGQDMNVPCHQGGVWVRDVKVNNETQQATLAIMALPSQVQASNVDALRQS